MGRINHLKISIDCSGIFLRYFIQFYHTVIPAYVFFIFMVQFSVWPENADMKTSLIAVIVGIALFELVEHVFFPLFWYIKDRKKKSVSSESMQA